MSMKIIFAWYDFWVGLFWDKDKRILYIFPVPCFGVAIVFRPKKESSSNSIFKTTKLDSYSEICRKWHEKTPEQRKHERLVRDIADAVRDKSNDY